MEYQNQQCYDNYFVGTELFNVCMKTLAKTPCDCNKPMTQSQSNAQLQPQININQIENEIDQINIEQNNVNQIEGLNNDNQNISIYKIARFLYYNLLISNIDNMLKITIFILALLLIQNIIGKVSIDIF